MSTREEIVSFAAQAAHDLNNNLAALTMAVELAADILPEGEADLASLFERVQRSSAKLSSAIGALPAAAEAWPLDDSSPL